MDLKQKRIELNTELEAITDNVYFAPDSNHTLKYPCIVYSVDDILTRYANNKPYSLAQAYQISVIDADADSALISKVALLPTSSFSRYFKSGYLHHTIFTLFI